MSSANSTTLYSIKEVRKHNTAGDVWIVLDGMVFDVTPFLHTHPGGMGTLMVSLAMPDI